MQPWLDKCISHLICELRCPPHNYARAIKMLQKLYPLHKEHLLLTLLFKWSKLLYAFRMRYSFGYQIVAKHLRDI